MLKRARDLSPLPEKRGQARMRDAMASARTGLAPAMSRRRCSASSRRFVVRAQIRLRGSRRASLPKPKSSLRGFAPRGLRRSSATGRHGKMQCSSLTLHFCASAATTRKTQEANCLVWRVSWLAPQSLRTTALFRRANLPKAVCRSVIRPLSPAKATIFPRSLPHCPNCCAWSAMNGVRGLGGDVQWKCSTPCSLLLDTSKKSIQVYFLSKVRNGKTKPR